MEDVKKADAPLDDDTPVGGDKVAYYMTKTGYIYSSMNNRITSKSKDEDNGRSPFSDSSLSSSNQEEILR